MWKTGKYKQNKRLQTKGTVAEKKTLGATYNEKETTKKKPNLTKSVLWYFPTGIETDFFCLLFCLELGNGAEIRCGKWY